jgi:hypothetical protein
LPVYLFFTRIPDGAAKPHPFVDLHDILLGGACWRAGVDVYTPSACLGGGVFNYSPLLLRLAVLPLGPADTLWLGWVFCAAYLAALALLPPPRTRRAFWLHAAAAFSPASYYALEQGNLDVLIFAAAVSGLWLLGRGGRGRFLAYALFAAGAAAKFYPVALLALAWREGKRLRRALVVAGAVGALLAVALAGHDILAALAIIPSGTPFRASFGRIDLPRGLALMGYLPGGAAGLVSWLLVLAAGAVAWGRRKAWRGERDLFLPGAAAVTVFCFLAAQNIEYRAIFLLPALPALLRRGRWGHAIVITLLLWEAVPRALVCGLTQPYLPAPPGFIFWLIRETLWWALAAEFAALLLAFAEI